MNLCPQASMARVCAGQCCHQFLMQIGMMIVMMILCTAFQQSLWNPMYGAVGSRCISLCDVAQSWNLLLRQIVHVIGSRAEDKHAVLCLRSAAC